MNTTEESIHKLGPLLLDIGANLMSSGANTSRIRITVERIAEVFGCQVDLLITHRALMLTISDEQGSHFFSCLKRTSPHGVNFRLVSGISRMSWRVVEEKWTLDSIQAEVDRLVNLPHYPRWQVLLLVSLAGASFCRLFGGTVIEMVITFAATMAGLAVRQEAKRLEYNPYLCIFFASMVSSLIAGLAVYYKIGPRPDYAFSTSVLYLVPGVPLINSFSDLIDGNIMNGVMRGINGLIISFAIAAGLLIALLLYNIQ